MALPKFKDGKGREWNLQINAGHIVGKKFQEIGWDFERETKSGNYESLLDPFKFCAILWVVCEKQADEKKVDPVDFAEGLTGDIITQAQEALLAAVLDFTQRSKISESAKLKLPTIFGQIDNKAVAAMNKALNETYSKLSDAPE